jgi:hypothetical protein
MVNDDALASFSPPFLLFALGRIHGATVLFDIEATHACEFLLLN